VGADGNVWHACYFARHLASGCLGQQELAGYAAFFRLMGLRLLTAPATFSPPVCFATSGDSPVERKPSRSRSLLTLFGRRGRRLVWMFVFFLNEPPGVVIFVVAPAPNPSSCLQSIASPFASQLARLLSRRLPEHFWIEGIRHSLNQFDGKGIPRSVNSFHSKEVRDLPLIGFRWRTEERFRTNPWP
jgi:hypothetical protein